MTLKFLMMLVISFPFFTFASSALEKPSFQIQQEQILSQPGQVHTVIVDMTMPKGFHAYSDQLKIVQMLPGTYKVGSLKFDPEVEFFDKYAKKTRRGLFEKGQIAFQIESPTQVNVNTEKINFELRYQICSEKVCYLPKTESLNFNFVYAHAQISATPETRVVASEKRGLFDQLEKKLAENLLLAYVLVFIAGILTSFTPCIFPMIPITLSILGHDAEKNSRVQNFVRSLLYVFGIALTYSILGVLAAMTGSLFGQALTNKFVLMGLAILFVLMAFSMWGAFDLQVPSFIRNKFGSGRSHGYVGAFIMGMVAGIVASPCVGPVLVSILSYVSTTQNVILGFTLLFTYALGLGLIFIFIGLFSQVLKLLPRSGPWMEAIKFVLGLLMVMAALYYLQFVISENYWYTLLGLSLVAISVWKGALQFRLKRPFQQSFFLALFIFSMTITLLSIFKVDYLQPLFRSENKSQTQNEVLWTVYSEEAIAAAKMAQQPVLLDFFAEWCAACHELEDKTYSEAEFKELSKSFKLIKIDATEDKPAVQKILDQYGVKGLPTVIFLNKKGETINDLTFTQFLEWKDLKPKMLKALEQ